MSDEDVKPDAGYVVEGPVETPVAEQEDDKTQAAPEAPEASAEEDQPEEEGWEKRVAKLTHAKKRAEAKIREQEAELAKYRPQASQELPKIPEIPSDDLRYDNPEEWVRQLKAREDAIAKHAEVRALKELERKRDDEMRQSVAKQQQAQVQQIVGKFVERGNEFGLSQDRMEYNEEVLKDAGVGPDLGLYIYEDPDGPRVADFLAANPKELEKVVNMTPLRAAEYIALTVKPKVGQVKPKTTRAPDPVKPAKGSGMAEKDPFAAIVPAGYTIE